MRTISPGTRYRKDLKRELRGTHRQFLGTRLNEALLLLQQDLPLPPRYFDHPLTGVWIGHRDCHIFPDLVLIYRKPENDTLELIRLGSHSELDL